MKEPRVILVTGANRGIGKEIVRQLAAAGHVAILSSRDTTRGAQAAEGMAGEVHVLGLDVGDPASMAAAAGFIAQKWGRLDAVINNAGVMSAEDGPAVQSVEEVRRVLDPNFFGIYALNQVLLPLLRQSADPRIINLSSSMGKRSGLSPFHAAYRLSKYLLNGYTIMLARELKSEGIKVNAMCPGWVRTDMGGANAARSVEQGADTAVWLATAPDTPHGEFVRDRKVIPW
ncbi:MAG: SDR family oxidoreductase [Bacteroidota bacterium]